MNWSTLLELKIENGSLVIIIGPLLLILVLLTLLILAVRVLRIRSKKSQKWKTVEVEASIANLGSIKLAPDNEIIRAAHFAWAELITRKAAQPFDSDNDVIVDIYDSWRELFREFRELTKSIPAEEVRNNRDAEILVELLVDAMNKGLRPHLTKWQAKYRHWCNDESIKHPELSPQELQRLFPNYNDLVDDLKRVNSELIGFAEALRKIAHG